MQEMSGSSEQKRGRRRRQSGALGRLADSAWRRIGHAAGVISLSDMQNLEADAARDAAAAATEQPQDAAPARRAGSPFGAPALFMNPNAAAEARLKAALRALRGKGAPARPNKPAARPRNGAAAASDGAAKTTRLRPALALRIAARSAQSPIALATLAAAPDLISRGVRVSALLAAEPAADADLSALASIAARMDAHPLEWWLRIADFDGTDDCFEQAMIGEELFWIGGRLTAAGPAELKAGRFSTPGASLKQETDAARLRFAAAWRLASAPSAALARRLSAANRAAT
ncbi:MAG: hypothetical protein AAGM38_11550 [Pseudomonadota bacterium]